MWERERVHWKHWNLEQWPWGLTTLSYVVCEECQRNIESLQLLQLLLVAPNSAAAETEPNSPDTDDNPWLGLVD